MIELLLQYQEIDRKLKAIEDSLKTSEEFKKYAQATRFLKTVNDNRVMYEERSGAVLGVFNEKQGQVTKLMDEKKELDAMAEDADEKELAYYKRRTQELAQMFSSLEAEINKLQQDLNDLLRQYSNFCKQTKVAVDQREEFKAKYETLMKGSEAEKTEIEKELGELEKKIEPRYIEKYKEKRKDGKFPIVCKVNDGYCTACGTELVIAEKEKLKTNKIIECSNCHILIYSE